MRKFTKRQLDVMNVLWNAKAPMSASDIANSDPSLNINTVRSTLNSLLKAELIEVSNIDYSGTVLSRQYSAVLTAEQYISENFSNVLDSFSTSSLVANFIQKEDDIQVVNELEKLLQARKKELKGN